MRQVPHYLIIGYGRLAHHLSHYFAQLSLSFESWHRGLPSAQLAIKMKRASHCLLLISDHAILDFIHQYLKEYDGLCIHCSGSLVTDRAFGAHPLMTFNQTHYYDFNTYQSIPFVIDQEAPFFQTLLPGLPNPSYRLDTKLKTNYHALCVMAGNFSCLLWQKLFFDFENKLKLPHDIAYPYLKQQMENLMQNPASALTGPLIRHDIHTINLHLQALQNDIAQPLYQSFLTYYQNRQREEQTS